MMILQAAGNTYYAMWDGKVWRDRAGHKWYQTDSGHREQNQRASRMFSKEHGSTLDWNADRPAQ